MRTTQWISYDVQESNNLQNDHQGSWSCKIYSSGSEIILFVENDGPNRHSSELSSSGGSMADTPDCESVVNWELHQKCSLQPVSSQNSPCWCLSICWCVITKGWWGKLLTFGCPHWEWTLGGNSTSQDDTQNEAKHLTTLASLHSFTIPGPISTRHISSLLFSLFNRCTTFATCALPLRLPPPFHLTTIALPPLSPHHHH